jgi:ADP-ribose pyrophosphatase YjhB (NUDIX family)
MERECRVHRLVADVAIRSAGSILLVRYRDVRRYDGQRGWFLPDDNLHHGEDPIGAARRIARDQAGLELPDVFLGTVESLTNGLWHLAFHLEVELATDQPPTVVAGENVAEHRWFPLDALPAPDDVAHAGWALQTMATLAASHVR